MNLVKRIIEGDFVGFFEEIMEHYKVGILVLSCAAVTGGGVYLYTMYRARVEQQAHKEFVRCMNYFEAPIGAQDGSINLSIETVSFATREEKWNKVAEVFEKGYQDHKNSYLAPLFLAYESEALLSQDKIAEAKEALKKVVTNINDPSLKNIYAVKLALLAIDTSLTEKEQQEGLATLQRFAGDSKNVAQDSALYHLGNYFWYLGDFASAKNYWNQLMIAYGPETKNPSPFAAPAKEKLKLIASK